MSHEPFALDDPARQECARRRADDELGTARCPLCRHPLIAHVSREGPAFACLCLRPAPTSGREQARAAHVACAAHGAQAAPALP